MPRQQISLPGRTGLKTLLVSFVLLFSGLCTSAPLRAEDSATEIARTDPSLDILAPVRHSAENVQNLFGDIKQYFGIRYRFGGQTPSGFDCSGFVRYMFSRSLNMELPRSSTEMSAIGRKVERSELKPGDLVFFRNAKNRINHVGIFVGNDTFVHSSLSRGITRDKLNESYFDKRFATGVRVLDIPEKQIQMEIDKLLKANDENGNPS
ncbi:MAG: NlpC/P60 family protein [Chlorobiaceae bacterium]|nr:NlpC/P60 family protein [Chlorobiaceae bacterium]